MRPKNRALLVFFGVLFCSAGCDHASKRIAISALGHAGGVSLASDALRLELVSNPGAFLSLGAGFPEAIRDVLFVGIVPLLVLCLCIHILYTHARSIPVLVGLGLVAGGGLGNWLDRLLHGGAVTDFITFSLGSLRTGVFNFADVAVLAGVGLLVLSVRGRGIRERGHSAS